ncbi:SusC/RagA family TonB-linked outer membrane protein [Chitinophaga sp. GCM10012297]|uniref:SusC/RagA family TonB-linked outer membrane protein n=1 Tax=Chitinophaga chungangae TaxID=2821488 RepID=A0ABS3Y7X7_9BACT|nr:SusC/RagA family TonB-linked outer membrane protein [Chitinophaga chungangae]MBO9150782.1 SusC/RagA family TonB-linked outer membrane protein [Chitinophaga chungangae]
MRWTTFLLLAVCLHVSAGSAAQNITYSGRQVPLERIFTEIEKQTGNVVFISKQLLKESKPVSVDVRDMPLSSFLALVLKDQPLEFTQEKQTVFIRKKPAVRTADPPAAAPAFFPVSGVVMDSLGGFLAGASVRVKGSNVSTVSDVNGQFTLQANTGDILLISYVGFKTLEFKVINSIPILVTLSRESTTITEVAVTLNTGYQSIPRERATGSFSIVNGKQLENKLRPDLKSALEGQVAGMQVTREGNIEVRGVSTFMLDERAPLIIVDGFPITGGLETLNIDNIESVTILKDGVAASIYGARSSNGVIVVTTKHGKRGTLNIQYNGSFGVTKAPDLSYLKRASAADYVDAELDIYAQNPNSYNNSYNGYRYLSRVNYLKVAEARGFMSTREVEAELAKLRTNDGIGQLQDYLFRNQLTQQHNIMLSGGNEKSQTAASAKFIGNRGNTLYAKDNRLIMDVRNDWKPAKFLSFRLFSNINYNTAQAPLRPMSDFLNYYSQYIIHPYDLVVDPATGQPQDIYATNLNKVARYDAIPGLKPMNYNPLTDLGQEITRTQNFQFRIGGNINIVLAKGLTLDAGGSWTRGNSFTRSVSGKDSYRMRMGYNDATSVSNPSKHYIPDGDMVNESRNVNQAYTLRSQLNFSRSFGKHSLIAIAGSEVSRNVQDYNAFPTRFGYSDQAGTFATFNYADYIAGNYNADMLQSSGKPTASIGSIAFRDNRFVSWYANASYEFDRRFLVSGSIRLDQTNFFGTDPRFRYKPLWSAGGTYKLSNEQFFHVPWLSKLYVRGSFGVNGNISLNSGPFLIIAPGSYSDLTGDISYNISSPPNNSLRWERTNTTNFGTDMSLFSRINVSIDYYLRKSKELLASDPVDPTLGYTSLVRNVGQINNTGLELAVDGDLIKSGDFSWGVLGTMSYNANKVVEYNVNYPFSTSLTQVSVNKEGLPANALYAFRFAGLDANGAAQYYNQKGEKVGGGAVAVDDVIYMGTLRPKFAYSLTNTFRYKNFELAFMLLAKTGNIMRRYSYDGNAIQHEDVGKRWKKPGDEKYTNFPALNALSFDFFYYPLSDIFIESGNFIKLRDASITYNFNKSLLRKAGIGNASIMLQGRNLFMWAANSDKLDPEAYELNEPNASQAELGFTPWRPMPEFYLGLRANF